MISLKRMIEVYVENECSEDTWNMFYQMANHELITKDVWEKFSKKCEDWYSELDGIYSYNELIYERDEDGTLVKVK